MVSQRDDQIDIETDHPEFTLWKWQEPSNLIAEIVPFKREVFEQVMEAFEGYLG